MSSKRSNSISQKKKSLKEYIREVEQGKRDIVEEDSITELGQFSILSSSKYSLRRHTCTLDANTSTYISLSNQALPEEIEQEQKISISAEPIKQKSKFEKFRHLRGFFYVLIYGLFFALSTIFIKRSYLLAGSDNSIIRYTLQFLIMFIITRILKIDCFGPKEQRVLLSVRGFIGQFALVSLHFSVTLIDPSDSIAISNSSLIVASILAWLFLKEKLTLAHCVSLVLTVFGILLISQPKFLFDLFKDNKNPSFNRNTTFNCSFNSLTMNRTLNYDLLLSELEAKQQSDEFSSIEKKCINLLQEQIRIKYNESIESIEEHFIMYELEHAPVTKKSSFVFYIGILCALIYSFGSGSVQILLKKLCMQKVHFSVSTIYSSYFGLPSSILISIVLFLTGVSHRHFNMELNFHLLPKQIFYSILSALCGVLSQICLNLALNYEDASKISILKSIDLLFTFVLQFLILNIRPGLLNLIGASLILSGSILVIAYKIIIEKKNAQKLQLKNDLLKSEIMKLTR